MTRILLIEDEPLVVRMYEKIFKLEGLNVDTASNGLEGIKQAKKKPPDLILLDIMMPVMNGIEVLIELKKDPQLAHIPVVMLTNLAGTKDVDTAMKKGAVAYLIKSEYKPKEVLDTVMQYISGKAPKGKLRPTVPPPPKPAPPPPSKAVQPTTPPQTSPPQQPPAPQPQPAPPQAQSQTTSPEQKPH